MDNELVEQLLEKLARHFEIIEKCQIVFMESESMRLEIYNRQLDMLEQESDWRTSTCGECGYWYNSDCSNFDNGTCRNHAWIYNGDNNMEGGFIKIKTSACPDFVPSEVSP